MSTLHIGYLPVKGRSASFALIVRLKGYRGRWLCQVWMHGGALLRAWNTCVFLTMTYAPLEIAPVDSNHNVYPSKLSGPGKDAVVNVRR